MNGLAAGAKFIGDATLSRRQRKRLNKLPSSVPIITPLPSLDPRSAANPNSLGDAYHPSGARCAHIVYLDSSPLSALLTPTSPHSIIPIKPDPSVPTGLPYYLALHASLRPSLAAVRAFADTSMARFDHLSSLLLSSRAKAQGAGALVDEDGFTVVVRSGKGGRTGGLGDGTRKGTTSVGVASRGFGKKVKGGEVEVKKGKGAQELPDFYKFQQMERKRQGESCFSQRVLVVWNGDDCRDYFSGREHRSKNSCSETDERNNADQDRTGRPAQSVRKGQGKSRSHAACEAVQAVLDLQHVASWVNWRDLMQWATAGLPCALEVCIVICLYRCMYL